jgi:shikimate dehydrogenase
MAYTFREFQQSEAAKKPHFLVIGHPISHSLSPVMHQSALDYYGINARYLALDLAPNEVASFIAWCNKEEFSGCNITIPYKELFMDVVDAVDPFAQHVGVINTIVKKERRLTGYNTDVFGFSEPLKPFLEKLESDKAIVFGTGGASKAVKTALEELGFEEIVFVSRNTSGKQIKSDSAIIHLADYSQWQGYADDAGLLVNTTPLGMYPDIEKSPVDESDVPLLEGKVCYDLVYNPMETTFLKQSSGHGGIPVNGLDMLIYQGSRAFELWTGKPFPISLIREKLIQYFRSDDQTD